MQFKYSTFVTVLSFGAIVFFFGRALPVRAAVDDNLGAEWRFDETARGQSVMDSSGNDNTGTPSGAVGGPAIGSPAASVTGQNPSLSTHSYVFDGSTNYLTVPSSEGLSPSSAMSVSVWVRTTSSSGMYLLKKNNSYEIGIGIDGASAGQIGFKISGLSQVNSTATVNDGAWHHVVVTYTDAPVDYWVFYIDGVLDSTWGDGDDGNAVPTASDALIIGAQSAGTVGSTGFNGSLDELRIYDRALEAEDISLLFGRGVGDLRVTVEDLYGNPVDGTTVEVLCSGYEGTYEALGVTGEDGTLLANPRSLPSCDTEEYINFRLVKDGYATASFTGNLLYFTDIDPNNASTYRAFASNEFAFSQFIPPFDGDGEGTEETPYVITTCQQLQEMASGLGAYYTLEPAEGAIDCTGMDFIPVGTQDEPFTGVLYGYGHTISHLTISQNSSNHVGLFGYTRGAEITSITLSDVSVSGVSDVGSVIGYAQNTSITEVTSTGSVSGSSSVVGGIIGEWEMLDEYNNSSNFSSLEFNGSVVGGDRTGGMIGQLDWSDDGDFGLYSPTVHADVEGTYDTGGLIGYLYAFPTEYVEGGSYAFNLSGADISGTVQGVDDVGGMIGYGEMAANSPSNNFDVNFQYDFSNIKVTATSNSVGGLVGQFFAHAAREDAVMHVTFNQCVSAGEITSTGGDVGGLVGTLGVLNYEPGSDVLVTVNQSYVTGDVTGAYNVGGLIGGTEGEGPGIAVGDPDATGGLIIRESYASGDVIGTDELNAQNIGGLVGVLDCVSINPDNTADVHRAESSACWIGESFAVGPVSGDYYVGGLVGQAEGDAVIYDAYARGTVESNSYVGGLVGYVNANEHTVMIDHVYATGTVSAVGETPYEVGGLVGYFDSGSADAILSNAFANSSITTEDGTHDFGWAIGSVSGEGSDLTNVWYTPLPSASVTDLACTGNDFTACAEEADPTAFYDSAHDLYSGEWDFEDVWRTLETDYPILQNVDAAPATETLDTPTVTATTATLHGELVYLGTLTVHEKGFLYGLDTTYAQRQYDYTSDAQARGVFSQTISDLTCGTTYYYRAYAISDIYGYGEERSFTTASCSSHHSGYVAPNLPGLPSDSSSGGGSSSGSSSGGSSSGGSSSSSSSGSSSSSSSTISTDVSTHSSNVTTDATSSHDTFTGHEVAEDSGLTGPSPYDASTEPISNVAPGWYIRGNNYDTVYFVTADGKRRPFWDIKTFFTYADSWDNVIWVTDATLATLPLADPMLPNTGVVLVKISSDATTYAIASNNVLQAIPDEQTAISLYGSNWADYVIDVDPTIMKWFMMGTAHTTKDTVDKLILKTRTSLMH